MVTDDVSRSAYLDELRQRIDALDLPHIESGEELARSEVARAARQFGFAQPQFRTSLKLRFTGEGVHGHALEGDVAAQVIGGITQSVSEAGSALRNLDASDTRLFLAPTVLAGSTVLELFGDPAPSAERLDIEIDDTPVDGAIDVFLDVLEGTPDQVPGTLGKQLYSLSQSLIDGQVDLDLAWTRPRGVARRVSFNRESASVLRDALDVDTVTTADVEVVGTLASISTKGQIGIIPQGKRGPVLVDAADWSPSELRRLWAETVSARWTERSVSHPMRDHTKTERKLSRIEAYSDGQSGGNA